MAAAGEYDGIQLCKNSEIFVASSAVCEKLASNDDFEIVIR